MVSRTAKSKTHFVIVDSVGATKSKKTDSRPLERQPTEPMIDLLGISDDGTRVDYVLANPPFGKKSSITITNEDGEAEKQDMSYNRQDFWETTANKQLNFLQHIKTMLKIIGEAAVVVT